MSDSREDLCRRFLAEAGWDNAERRLLAADASFRSYDRLSRSGETAVLMNAPPPQENVQVFRHIADLLLDIELSAPRPLAVDQEAGFLLLEDFGDRTFTRALAEGADEGDLYRLAVDTLIALHRRWYNSDMTGLPPYDEQRLLDEAALLVDWYLPAVTGRETPAALRESYLEAWRAAVPVMLGVPQSLVLRDYHVDNLMILEGREGVARCGLLDFQDAVIGPVSYDLVSLLEDARRDVAPELASEMLARYRDAFRHIDHWAFAASYAALGAQRNAKIIGIFTRLCRRDGKAHYLKHIPRVWRLLEGDLQHPALAGLAAWFAREVPPELRVTPQENQ
ncbi:MAG TPA: aminoglycoside phosphotransferase [Kiloniellaceae bacterium]|nr:aminoglycoside phosphotransferase [Kiloniellaceae bacterium]